MQNVYVVFLHGGILATVALNGDKSMMIADKCINLYALKDKTATFKHPVLKLSSFTTSR